MWPAFWSYGDPWPTQGEIDIMEARGSEPYQYQTNYFFGRRAGYNLVQGASGFVTSSSSLVDCFHVYEVIWAKNTLTFMLDNAVVDTKSGGYIPSFYGRSERVVVNVAVGGNFFSDLDPAQIQPGTMLVDWVKVFTSR
jgi:beta-glucanase (GH16 family)